MADVIDLNDERQAREPHATLHTRCVDCGHEWQAVAPMPWPSKLECPRCPIEAPAVREDD
jgi:predicted Zn-ribbon and HTH transcriptional regulator